MCVLDPAVASVPMLTLWLSRLATHRLTAEIASFVSFIRPTPDEHELRTLVVEGLRRAIRSEWPDADVYPFGSFGTLLYLPGGCVTCPCFLDSRLTFEK